MSFVPTIGYRFHQVLVSPSSFPLWDGATGTLSPSEGDGASDGLKDAHADSRRGRLCQHFIKNARISGSLRSGKATSEDIELRRNDEVFLDALGATRIPDPTTAGDFCRRFGEGIVVGTDHHLADPKPVAKMLKVVGKTVRPTGT